MKIFRKFVFFRKFKIWLIFSRRKKAPIKGLVVGVGVGLPEGGMRLVVGAFQYCGNTCTDDLGHLF